MSARPLLAEPYRSALLAAMQTAVPRCYAQVATVAGAGDAATPRVRTITLHHVDELDALAFSTSTSSAKWAELRARPRLAGVFFDLQRFVQYRWEGPVELAEASAPERGELLRRMWRRVSPGVRWFTWDDYCRNVLRAAPAFDVDEPCPIEGLVVCRPERWDVLEFDVEDYGRSRRTVLTWAGTAWHGVAAPLQRAADG
jgi:hypothetical protein